MFKFAIVGCGRRALVHAEHIGGVGQLVGVCDVDIKKANDLAIKYGAATYHTLDDLLINQPDIDIVCVCTPNGCHAEHCIKSLQAGLHVLCEGPLCLTSAAAWQIIETEKFCRKKLFVVNPVVLLPAVIALKNKIEIPTQGQIFEFVLSCTVHPDPEKSWRNLHFPGGGVLYSYFSWYIDLILFLFGDFDAVMVKVDSKNNSLNLATEIGGKAFLHLKNGSKGSIHWKLDHTRKHYYDSLVITDVDGLVYENRNLADLFKEVNNTYHLIYDQLFNSIRQHGSDKSGLYLNLKSVESIEKIYKAVN